MGSAQQLGKGAQRRGPSWPSESVVYGCNTLRQKHQRGSSEDCDHRHDSYVLLATPLRGAVLGMDYAQGRVCLASCQPPCCPDGLFKVPELVTVIEEVLSPSLSTVSDRSGDVDVGLARTTSPPIPRIEDSLEELDKLEDELEAVNAATLARGLGLVENKACTTGPKTPSQRPRSMALERASAAGRSLTVRVKPCDKAQPALRRAASLTLRNKKEERADGAAEHKAASTSYRDKATGLRDSTPRPTARSRKRLTVPKFELPGYAVAKRLREQHEARQAQQAEAHSEAQTNTPKARAGRPLAKPTFELPGEAISRRKREEREAKLRAEEEERRRCVFKARSLKHMAGPATLPRETVASRARQNRCSHEEPEAQAAGADKMGRVPVTPDAYGKSLPTRGRKALALGPKDSSRATSAEEREHQRARGKEVLARDGVVTKDRERGRRERKSTTKLAREQAAERSRTASREWADKKRLKEVTAREGAPQAGLAGARALFAAKA